MSPNQAQRYTLHQVRSEDLDLYFVVATGGPTDPVHVACQGEPQRALETLTPTPFFGRQGMKAIQYAIEGVLQRDPSALDSDAPTPTWRVAADLWDRAQRWRPYSFAVEDGEFHLYYQARPTDGATVALGVSTARDDMVRSLLGDYARMSGRATFDLAALHKLYYEAKGQLAPAPTSPPEED